MSSNSTTQPDALFNDTERLILADYLAQDYLEHANMVARSVTPSTTFYSRYIKRLLDIVLSGLALIITSPINLAIAIVTFFDVGAPIFFMQSRVGKDCKDFRIVKFRNMTNATDENGVLLLPKDRVTKWGKFVRKTSLDELLNFWSVFKGDMSLIGPRPLLQKYLPRYSERHRMRHAVRPGLECPNVSQFDPSVSKWERQFENDVWYVENVSFLTDLKMAIALVKLVFNRKEVKSRGTAQRGAFMGYDQDGKAISNNNIPQEYLDRMYAEFGTNITPESYQAVLAARGDQSTPTTKVDFPPRKKTVGVFIRGFHNGGIEKVFEAYFSHMDLEPYELHIVTHCENIPEKKAYFESLGCVIHELQKVRGSKIAKKNIAEYRQLFSQVKFDVVHNNMPENLLPMRFAKSYGVPVRILHAHNDYLANVKNPLKAFAYRIAYDKNASLATQLVGVSALASQSAFGSRAGKAMLLPNAIETEQFAFCEEARMKMREELGLASNQLCLIHVGRYENDQKNQEFVLETFAGVKQQIPSARLLMLGEGPRRAEFQEMAIQLGVADAVTFTGAVSNVPDCLCAADVFLLPSRKEGLGISAVEAQCAGLPCIVSNRVPAEAKVTDNITFLSIDEGVQQWVDAIAAVQGCERNDASATVRAAGYDINDQAFKLAQLYLEE